MNYQEAEARFQWLESQRAAGRMSDQIYRDELHQIRVVDASGRHWMLQERTGQWPVDDGAQWRPAAPPGQPPVPPPRLPPNQRGAPQPGQSNRRGCSPGKVVVYLML